MAISRMSILGGVALLMAGASAMAADDKVPSENGFSGNIVIGAGYIDVSNNTVKGNSLIDIGNETISSVNESAQSESDGYPVVTGEVDYTFGDRWQAFFGTVENDIVNVEFTQRLGLRKQWDSVGVTGLSLLWTGLKTQVWEDPYQVGTPRNDTDQTATGARFDWWRIFGTGVYFQAQIRRIDLDDEQSGTDPALALTQAQINQLRRDGHDSRVTVGYSWESGPITWRPELFVGKNNRDGSAETANVMGIGLNYTYRGDLWTTVATASFTGSSFDTVNPIYNEYANAGAYEAGLSIFRKLDIGGGGWSVGGAVAYGNSNSDINFLDADALSINLAARYKFGER